MAKEKLPIEERSIWPDAHQMLQKAERDGVETAWDRLETQTPHCKFCELGTTCRNCVMGPCRISDKEGSKMKRGVCGADADVVVARNFGRFIAGGQKALENGVILELQWQCQLTQFPASSR